jgi:hypothetical protein
LIFCYLFEIPMFSQRRFFIAFFLIWHILIPISFSCVKSHVTLSNSFDKPSTKILKPLYQYSGASRNKLKLNGLHNFGPRFPSYWQLLLTSQG